MNREKSEEEFSKMEKLMPGGVNSPIRAWGGLEKTPLIAKEGRGDQIIDIDGHSYIDYCQSWGALIHGHSHDTIVDAACKRVKMGTTFGTATKEEGSLAKKILGIIGCMDKIRFVSSGTEALMSVARLARSCTGREHIVKFDGNFHGHSDLFLIRAGSALAGLKEASSKGVPNESLQNMSSLQYNNLEQIETLFKEKGGQIAAVILEPVAANMGVVPAKREFLEALRRLTREYGAFLIFDEVISGFRVALGGAIELFGVVPDIVCYGKLIGGGFPAAAFAAKAEIMDELAPLGPCFQSGTLSGNPVAMSAGLAALELLEQDGFYEELEEKAAELVKEAPCTVNRVGSLFTFFFGPQRVEHFDDALKCDPRAFKEFFHHMFENGIFIPPSQFEAWFLSAAHTKNSLKKTKECLARYFEDVYSLKV